MGFIIDFIRRHLICRHKYEYCGEFNKYKSYNAPHPYSTVKTYICEKCGNIRRVKR